MWSQHSGHGRSTLGRKAFGREVAANAGSPRPEAAARVRRNACSVGCLSQARFTASQRGTPAIAGALTRPATNLATSRLKTTARGTSPGAGSSEASPVELRRGLLAGGVSWTSGGCSGPACSQCQKAQRRSVSSKGPMTSGSRRQTPRPAVASPASPAARASSACSFPSPYESAWRRRFLVFSLTGRVEADSDTCGVLAPLSCTFHSWPAHELTS
mmetsp:Transcript_101464/g.302642  ORF Transcript_101464/g.302642 Transcript_101464/m.302642 type:complete len:215 (+) Transcript_101464:288-932(+)